MEHLRNLLVASTIGSARLIETSELYKKRYLEEAALFSPSDLLRLIKIAADTDTAIRWNQSTSGGRFKLEIGLLQMIRLDRSVQIGELLQQLEGLKKKLAAGSNETVAAPRAEAAAPALAPAIRGSVKASQPNLRPEQVVQAATLVPVGMPTLSAPVIPVSVMSPVPRPVAAESLPAGRLSIDEAHAKWPALIAEVCKKRILVGTMLSETALVGVESGNLKISCPDDFHQDQLVRNRQFITELAQNIYGAKVRLDTILANARSRELAAQPSPAEARPAEQPVAAPAGRHPVIEALVREFGAREIT
jgi:hypothetical protein